MPGVSGGNGATAPADLLVIGAGAKAAAVAAKVHAVNTLGLGPLRLTIVEDNRTAASWLGLNGMTSGDETLAITPYKDVGFPYESRRMFGDAGAEIDRVVLGLGWQQHLVERGELARWINGGTPSVRHRDYGRYLAWVVGRATAGVTIVEGRAERIELEADGGGWVVRTGGGGGAERALRGRALMLTGSGLHRHLPHDDAAEPWLLHCDSPRSDLARIPVGGADVAIVGGGEGALSCLLFLRELRPDVRITVYTPSLPLSRGESFLENRVFADPDSVGWERLDLSTRRAFVQRCDRGVFDATNLAKISCDDRCRFVTGRVLHVTGEPDGGVCLDYASVDGPRAGRHDYVVNCTGFDVLAQVEPLFPPAVRAAIQACVGPVWGAHDGAELPIGRALDFEGLRPRLHVPGLAGVAQGPGFANLGCLGLLANRVLEPCLRGDGGALDTVLSDVGAEPALEA